jgi:NADPH-dependent 2,4-dienoyl-CoA reductase/sulfur reductase-like enzyme
MTSTQPPRAGRTVIVGAGLAGMSAAERLRERGYSGELVVVGDEEHHPYNRAPLSKHLLTGDYQPRDLRLRTFTELDAIWRTGTRAIALDVAHRAVVLPHGERLAFDGLVIATGVEARHLRGTPLHSPWVWMLRTLDDARAIDTAMAGARHVAIIGGGFIGCEIASTARTRGLDATIIDLSPTLLAYSLGHALVAAGDVARWPNPRFGPQPRRVEHWLNAIEMGQAAADALLTGPGTARPFAPVPRFWSEQHGVRIQAVGMATLGDTMTVLEGSLKSRRFIAGRTSRTPHDPPILHAAVALDSPRGLLAYRDLIGQPLPVPHPVPA